MISIEVPIKPVSVNQAFRSIPRGKFCTAIKSKEYRQFEEDMLKLLPKKEMIKGDVELTVEFHMKLRYSNSDTANFVKPLVDILEKAEYFENDNKIVAEHYYKYKADDWKIKVIITEA